MKARSPALQTFVIQLAGPGHLSAHRARHGRRSLRRRDPKQHGRSGRWPGAGRADAGRDRRAVAQKPVTLAGALRNVAAQDVARPALPRVVPLSLSRQHFVRFLSRSGRAVSGILNRVARVDPDDRSDGSPARVLIVPWRCRLESSIDCPTASCRCCCWRPAAVCQRPLLAADEPAAPASPVARVDRTVRETNPAAAGRALPQVPRRQKAGRRAAARFPRGAAQGGRTWARSSCPARPTKAG